MTPPPVVGRVEEIAATRRMVDDLLAGRGAVLWVEGEPGIGKSTVLAVAAEQARSAGIVVFSGGGDAAVRELPLRMIADCLDVGPRSPDPVRRQIAELLRGARPAELPGDPTAIAAELMSELVEQRCAREPVVLVADDVHWADHDSTVLLRRLLRLTEQMPLLLMIGSRRREAAALRAEVERRHSVCLDLTAMPAADVDALVSRRVGPDPGEAVRRQVALAAGNPLFVVEILDSVGRGAAGDAATGPGADAPLPASLQAVVAQRLAGLSPSTRRVVETAAVLGGAVDTHVLARCLSITTDEVETATGEAVAAGVLAGSEGRRRFRHPLIQEALIESTPGVLRRALHGHVAGQLVEDGGSSAEVVRHLDAGPVRLPRWAPGWLAEVEADALLLVPGAAGRLVRTAIDTVREGSPVWQRLVLRASRVSLPVPELVADLTRLLAERLDPDDLVEAVIAVADDDWRQQRRELACSRLRELLGSEQITEAGRVRVLIDLGGYLDRLDDPEGPSVALAAEQAAIACGDPRLIAEAARVRAREYPGPEAVRRLDEVAAALPLVPEAVHTRTMLELERIWLVHMLGLEERRVPLIEEALRTAEQWAPTSLDDLNGSAAAAYFETGRWDQALDHLAMMRGDSAFEFDAFRETIAASIEAARGDVESARELLERFRDHPRLPGETAQLLVLLGQPDEALGLVRRLMDLGPLARISATGAWTMLTRLALDAGDDALAREVAELVRADAERLPLAVHLAERDGVVALVDGDAAGLVAAGEAFRTLGFLPLAARMDVGAAECAARSGDTAAAKAALDRAVTTFESFGATLEIRTAEARLRACGVARGPRSRHRKATVGWEALTPTEQTVAVAVASGLSNPDIARQLMCSRRTVETHVSHLMAKLGVTARAQVQVPATRASA